MKKSTFRIPLAVLGLGAPFLAWQHRQLADERARAEAAAANLARIAAEPEASAAREMQAVATAAGTSSGPSAAATPTGSITSSQSASTAESDVVSLSSLTQGIEATLDLGKGGEQLLQTNIIEAVAALTPAQLRATFAAVTKLVESIPPDELARGRASDPEQTRAMLLLTPLMGRLQRESPETALAWMASPDLPPFFRQQAGRFAEETVRSFARANPQAALAWLQENAARLPEGNRAWPAALGAMAETDLPGALKEAAERAVLADTLKSAIPALTTPDARRQWSEAVMTIDDPARRGRRWSALVEHEVATGGWQAALSVLGSELPAEARTPENFRSVVEAGVAASPIALADQLASLPAETSAQLMPEFVARWADRDYNATAAWLGLAPPGVPWRDAAIASFVGKIRSVDPDAARTWANTIKNPALRAQATAF